MTEPIVRYGIAGTCGDGQGMLIEQHERIVTKLLADNLRLRLLADHASTYWHDGETEYEDPSEFARENRLTMDHVFPLNAAAYWPVEFRVIKADEDNDDYQVVQFGSTRRADFPEYFKVKAQCDSYRQMVRTLLGIADVLDTADGWLVVRESARKELEDK